jgi:hypothetical protein
LKISIFEFKVEKKTRLLNKACGIPLSASTVRLLIHKINGTVGNKIATTIKKNKKTVTSEHVAVLPMNTLVILFGLELGVALTQTYLFVILIC